MGSAAGAAIQCSPSSCTRAAKATRVTETATARTVGTTNYHPVDDKSRPSTTLSDVDPWASGVKQRQPDRAQVERLRAALRTLIQVFVEHVAGEAACLARRQHATVKRRRGVHAFFQFRTLPSFGTFTTGPPRPPRISPLLARTCVRPHRSQSQCTSKTLSTSLLAINYLFRSSKRATSVGIRSSQDRSNVTQSVHISNRLPGSP